MGEVLEFPGFDERNWRGIEAAVAEGLKRCGMPDDGITWVQSELKRRLFHTLPSTTVSIEVPMPAALSPFARDLVTTIGKQFQQQYRDILDALTGQIIWAVIELYLARLAEPPLSPPRKAQIFEFIPVSKQDDKDVNSIFQGDGDQKYIFQSALDRPRAGGQSLETSPIEPSRKLFRLDPTCVEIQFLPPRQYPLPAQHGSQ